MKRTMTYMTKMAALVLLMALFGHQRTDAQIVNEVARKKVSIGVGMLTDIWLNMPDGFKTRAINQGFQCFAAYNVPFGKSNFALSVGLGFRAENLFVKQSVFSSNSDSTYLVKLPDSIDVKRSKLALPYIEIPIEFYVKTKPKVSVGIGFKIGYLFPAHTKYVGENYLLGNGDKYRVKYREVQNLQMFSYGPTLRIGYRWFNVTGYYSLSKIFEKGRGPEMYPISVGFVLMPF